jgi:hypothetical protein
MIPQGGLLRRIPKMPGHDFSGLLQNTKMKLNDKNKQKLLNSISFLFVFTSASSIFSPYLAPAELLIFGKSIKTGSKKYQVL